MLHNKWNASIDTVIGIIGSADTDFSDRDRHQKTWSEHLYSAGNTLKRSSLPHGVLLNPLLFTSKGKSGREHSDWLAAFNRSRHVSLFRLRLHQSRTGTKRSGQSVFSRSFFLFWDTVVSTVLFIRYAFNQSRPLFVLPRVRILLKPANKHFVLQFKCSVLIFLLL